MICKVKSISCIKQNHAIRDDDVLPFIAGYTTLDNVDKAACSQFNPASSTSYRYSIYHFTKNYLQVQIRLNTIKQKSNQHYILTRTSILFRIYMKLSNQNISLLQTGGCSGRDRMVVGFTTIYAISVYHHQSCEFESCS